MVEPGASFQGRPQRSRIGQVAHDGLGQIRRQPRQVVPPASGARQHPNPLSVRGEQAGDMAAYKPRSAGDKRRPFGGYLEIDHAASCILPLKVFMASVTALCSKPLCILQFWQRESSRDSQYSQLVFSQKSDQFSK